MYKADDILEELYFHRVTRLHLILRDILSDVKMLIFPEETNSAKDLLVVTGRGLIRCVRW